MSPFCGFDEYDAIEGFFLEQKMCNALDSFIQFRVADPRGIFRVVMPFCFDVFVPKVCRGMMVISYRMPCELSYERLAFSFCDMRYE